MIASPFLWHTHFPHLLGHLLFPSLFLPLIGHLNSCLCGERKKLSYYDLKSWVTGGTKIRPGTPSNNGEYLSQFDSNILQLLGILGIFQIKMTSFFLSVYYLLANNESSRYLFLPALQWIIENNVFGAEVCYIEGILPTVQQRKPLSLCNERIREAFSIAVNQSTRTMGRLIYYGIWLQNSSLWVLLMIWKFNAYILHWSFFLLILL